MLRFCLLGSGSAGNALLVGSPGGSILIDNGLSFRQLQMRIGAVGERIEDVRALFITHEHGDHVNGAGILARKRNLPVYMTPGTRANLPRTVGVLPRIVEFEAGEALDVDGFRIGSFSVAHDAADPVSYTVEWGGLRLGLAADLGHASNVVRTKLGGAHALIVESNYCPEMLRRGSYPPAIQQRIRGRHGHMSNTDACSLLAGLVHEALRYVVLIHISEENNTPELAYRMARQAINGVEAEVHIARQDGPTPVFNLAPVPA